MNAGPGPPRDRLRELLEESRAWAAAQLHRLLPLGPEVPRPLAEAVRHSLFGGGKRLRPCLVRLTGRHLGAEDEACARPAVAVELIHTYSLIHDDLPSMDDDELRRGRPTCHVAHGEATAILAGDALQAAAFEVLCGGAGGDPARVADGVSVLARAVGAGGLVGGQVLDLSTPGEAPGIEEVAEIHLRKTALLIEAAAELGAVAAGAGGAARGAARRYGRSLGLLFQAVDDLLDVTGDAATLGKTPGKDARLERATLVASLGLEGARGRAGELAEEARDAARAMGCGPGDPCLELAERVLDRRR